MDDRARVSPKRKTAPKWAYRLAKHLQMLMQVVVGGGVEAPELSFETKKIILNTFSSLVSLVAVIDYMYLL